MKSAVLLSIRPKWCALIASGKKTLEIRKTRPKYDPPFKVYIYCTKGGGYDWGAANGKVIGEFACDAVEDYSRALYPLSVLYREIRLCACITDYLVIANYLHGKSCYGWYISDLVIYDQPRELSEFYIPSKVIGKKAVKRPPQSWCYVMEK